MSVTTYRDYDVINDEKFFLDEDEAIAYWNDAISRETIIVTPMEYLSITA